MGASQVSWQYGPSGQVTLQNEQGAGTSEGPISRRYDSADRLLGTTTPAGQLSYDYDGAGQILRKSVTIQGRSVGTAGHEYDGAGRLIAHTAPDGTISRYFHDSAGRLIRTERALQAVPAGQPLAGESQSLITHYRYDDDDLLTAIAHVRRIGARADTDTVLAGQALSRAPGGAITQLRTYRGGAETAPALRYDSASGQFSGAAWQQHDYEYDANARLTRETITAAAGALITDTRYRYDSVGNRIGRAVTDSAGTTHSSYEYDSADRLVRESTLAPGAASAAVTVYGWDAAGRLASRSEGSGRTVLYRWDGASRLIDLRTGASAAQASAAAPLIRYGYDADGQRVRKHVADSASGATRTVHYLLGTSAAHAQVAARATTVQEVGGATRTARSVFHWGAGSGAAGIGLIRQEHWADGDAGSGTPTALLLPLQGHLGTSLGAVDASGRLVETIGHDAFGQRTDASAAAQSHRFAGEYWDEDAQLVYLRARWYDPKLGRFISGDPFEGRQQDPRSLNRYGYAHNDPVHSADPSGEFSVAESSIASNIQVGLANLQADFGFNMIGGALNADDVPGVDDVAFGMLAVLGPQARVVAKLSKKPKQLKLGSPGSSKILGENLRVMGKHPGSATDQAHHIVAKKASEAAQSQGILSKHKIDINSPANGVWLPKTAHCGGHCNNYYQEVNRVLAEAHKSGGKAAVMAALKDLERRLISGELKVHRY